MKKNIELEYRIEIHPDIFLSTLSFFQNKYKQISKTKRLSFMSFSKNKDKQLDFRVRMTNKDLEVVLKLGDLYTNDRIEISQNILKDQFIGFCRMFSHLSGDNYIAYRETYNFETKEGIIISLVDANGINYIEYEFISNEANIKNNNRIIKEVIKNHGFKILDEKGFKELNSKLDRADWKFKDTPKNINRLTLELEKMTSENENAFNLFKI
jgi:hypothetical protein